MHLSAQISQYPTRHLIACFLGWKAILLLIATTSPGPGYDTSANLLISNHSKSLLYHVSEKLTRWDAIYFVKIATRGYRYEQEWAFGWGFTRLIALCTAALNKIGLPHFDGIEGIVSICVAHLSHLLSVLVLYQLTLTLFPHYSRSLAFIVASLHIISPAGLFLSAPYAESSCALLSFAGTFAFYGSFPKSGLLGNLLVLLSGLLFGCATTFRSNGILNGLLLLEEAIRLVLSLKDGREIAKIIRILSTGAAGIICGAGFILPQYIAYTEYCGGHSLVRPWCVRTIPSIYIFVQDHYWNNGLFRYWTPSNIPLFLLATPVFTMLFVSSFQVLTSQLKASDSPGKALSLKSFLPGPSAQILHNLAFQQLLLALFTLTTGHVQIVSRISSAYPVWLWYCAELLQGKDARIADVMIRFMAIYAIVQAGLYASFLPPA